MVKSFIELTTHKSILLTLVKDRQECYVSLGKEKIRCKNEDKAKQVFHMMAEVMRDNPEYEEQINYN